MTKRQIMARQIAKRLHGEGSYSGRVKVVVLRRNTQRGVREVTIASRRTRCRCASGGRQSRADNDPRPTHPPSHDFCRGGDIPPMEILKVSATSKPVAVAGAITGIAAHAEEGRGPGDRRRGHQPGDQGDRHLSRLRRTGRPRLGVHPVVHRHLHRRRGAHRHSPGRRGPLASTHRRAMGAGTHW